MTKQWIWTFCLLAAAAVSLPARQGRPGGTVIHKVVDMVQLNVAVTDRKGHYVTGLTPADFVITEDGMPQRIATFEEGNEAPREVAEYSPATGAPQVALPSSPGQVPDGDSAAAAASGVSAALAPPLAGANVFILFDSSNYMFPHRSFVYAQDSIAEFVRSLDGPDRIAFYSYSRDLTRATRLTPDREAVLGGVRSTTDGDDAALYNALLLTLKDANQYSGRKVLVVFSNGPDNASMIAPEDVGDLAQSEGIPIYMVSTVQARLDAVSTAVFSRISASTGGEAFFSKNWEDQRQAFAAIREDLAHLYLLSYYPQPNPNRGWRTIKVRLRAKAMQKYHIRTRSGYRPLPPRVDVYTPPAHQR